MVPLIMLLFLCSTALTQYPSFPLYPQNLPAVNGQVPLYPSLVVPGNQVYVFVNTTKLSHSQNFTKHDYVFGTKGFRDSVLLHSFVYKKPRWWSSYAFKEITFPPPNSNYKVNITQISALDRGVNGTGGFVKLVSGGIGRGNVTLAFTSYKGMPINFELDIYGHRKF